ncbi:sulfite exporter TauE/SafE family protein [Candidatus Uabimicrobium sp. HlEnr_7]|uniref:sulfite exporter TauE/SafE family protein n=1 Tax=Candidatus Uabimicrobium helgolandensis TaxID=3095367 RepID=UPI003558EE9C
MNIDFSSLAMFVAGIVMAIINILAGGGSIISIPLLIFAGISPTEANATNRVAILFQNASAIVSFAKQGIVVLRESSLFLVPSLVGAFLGANLGVFVSDELFKKIFAIVIPVSLGIMFFQRKKSTTVIMNKPLLLFVFFCVGVYGGFVQVGVGFIIILTLTSFTNFDLIRINAIKATIVFSYTILAVVVFAVNQKIQWQPAFFLSSGAIIGGWMGSYISVKVNEVWIKLFIFLLGIVFSIRLIFF